MSKPMEFELVFRAQTASARAATAELRKEVGALGNEANQSAGSIDKHAAALDRDTAAVENMSRANDNARRTIASIGSAVDAVRPSMDRLINDFARISAPAANRNGRAADIAAYGQELDKLQAKFDPVFAAQQRYLTKIEEINQAQRVGAISASSAVDIRLREKNSYDALINNLDRLAVARKAAAEGVVAKVSVTPDRGADIEAYGRQLDQMRAKYNPVYATLTAYKARLAEIREAHKVGAISSDEMTAAISRQRQATLATVAALKGMDPAKGGVDDRAGQFRRQNLTYQLFDIGQTGFMGMNPMMILAQQGPQVAQIYAGQGGVNMALKDLGVIASGAARLLTPLTLGIGAVAAGAALGVIAYSNYLASMKEVETAANGLGRATAGTATAMEQAARAGAASAGISVSSARGMEAQFLRTGRIGSENFASLIGVSKDFAATIGIASSDAGSALAELFADPAQAAQTLYEKYGLIDAATARQATNLANQNRQSEAQAVLLAALPSHLADAAEATTALGRAWAAVSNAAGNAMDAMGGAIDRVVSGPSLEERIAAAQAARDRQNASPFSAFANLLTPLGMVDASQSADLERLQEEKRQKDAAEAERKRQAEEIARSRAAVAVANASPANANSIREQTLHNDIAAAQAGRSAVSDTVIGGQIDTAIDAKTRALDALINRQQRALELDRLDIQIQNERNPLLRAELEARRARLQMASEEVSADTIAAEAARVRTRVIEETIAAAATQASDMNAELEIRQRLNAMVASGALTSADANRLLQEETVLRPRVAAAAAAEDDEKERLNKVISDLRTGYANLATEQKRSSALEYLRGQDEKLQQLRLEKALIGENETVRARAIAQLEAEQKIRSMGLDTNSAEAAGIREKALAAANLNREIERQADAWGKVKTSAENSIDGIVDGLMSGDIGSALEGVAKDITSMLTEISIKNPLKNAILGTDYGTISDIGGIGGIFSRLFGGSKDTGSLVSQALGQTVGSMSVNAATVIVNGGLSGGAGGLASNILGAAANDNSAIGKYAAAIKSIESGGNYSALGPVTASGDRAYGAYQVMGANIPSWTKGALGYSLNPSQFLSNSSAQDAVFAKYFGASVSKFGNPQDAASVWFTGRPQSAGGGSSDILGTTGNQYVQKFNTALGKLGNTAAGATQNLGQFGSGLGQLGQNLTNFFPSAPSGGGGIGGWFAKLFGGGLTSYGTSLLGSSAQFSNAWSSGGIGLYDVGGWTGPGAEKDVAGVVHADEFVFSKKAVQRVGVAKLDAMHKGLLRGYDSGGYVSAGSVYPSAVNSNVAGGTRSAIVVNNYSGAHVQAEEKEDDRGGRQTIFTLSEGIAAGIAKKGGKANRTIEEQYNVSRRGISR